MSSFSVIDHVIPVVSDFTRFDTRRKWTASFTNPQNKNLEGVKSGDLVGHGIWSQRIIHLPVKCKENFFVISRPVCCRMKNTNTHAYENKTSG
jgi:hypothetical protein